jgi:hypothetical protein
VTLGHGVELAIASHRSSAVCARSGRTFSLVASRAPCRHRPAVSPGHSSPGAGSAGGQVLRTAPVNPAMNNAANTHASTRSTQPAVTSHAAVALAASLGSPQPARARVVPTGRLRSSPTLTRWITVHGWPEATVSLVCASAPCAPSTTASTHDSATTAARNSSARQGWYPYPRVTLVIFPHNRSCQRVSARAS